MDKAEFFDLLIKWDPNDVRKIVKKGKNKGGVVDIEGIYYKR